MSDKQSDYSPQRARNQNEHNSQFFHKITEEHFSTENNALQEKIILYILYLSYTTQSIYVNVGVIHESTEKISNSEYAHYLL